MSIEFIFEPYGGGECGGCGLIEFIDRYPVRFAPGSTVYSKSHAQKGILRKAVVKTPIVRLNSCGKYVTLYKDSENGLWNDWELLPYAEAVWIVRDYFTRQIAMMEHTKSC